MAINFRGRRGGVRVLTTDGVDYIFDLSDSDASTVGRHWNAVRTYLETGDGRHELRAFAGVEVEGSRETGAPAIVELQTDLDAIEQIAWRGEVRFESIYDEVQ